MAHDLPVADSTPLARSPLALVVCQLRFEETLAVGDGRTIIALHKELGGQDGPYPKIEAVKGSRINIPVNLGGPAGAPTETQFAGWRMQSNDGWIVTVMPDSVSLETTKYTTWTADFSPRLGRLVEAAAKHIRPATEQRLGLRYVDQVVEPPITSPDQWKGLIADGLLGPILHPTLGPLLRGAQQQLLLDLGDGIRSLVRTGLITDAEAPGRFAFVLDFDVFREGVREFDVESVKAAAEELHDLNLRLFQQATSPELRRELAVKRRGKRGG